MCLTQVSCGLTLKHHTRLGRPARDKHYYYYNIVVKNAVAPDDSNKRSSKYSHSFFQILVSLDTISDWPWWVSWQHIYSQSLPTKKPQATVPTSLKASHTLQYSFVSSTFKGTGAWGKSWSRQIYVYDLNLLSQQLVQCIFYRMTLDQFFPQHYYYESYWEHL